MTQPKPCSLRGLWHPCKVDMCSSWCPLSPLHVPLCRRQTALVCPGLLEAQFEVYCSPIHAQWRYIFTSSGGPKVMGVPDFHSYFHCLKLFSLLQPERLWLLEGRFQCFLKTRSPLGARSESLKIMKHPCKYSSDCLNNSATWALMAGIDRKIPRLWLPLWVACAGLKRPV